MDIGEPSKVAGIKGLRAGNIERKAIRIQQKQVTIIYVKVNSLHTNKARVHSIVRMLASDMPRKRCRVPRA